MKYFNKYRSILLRILDIAIIIGVYLFAMIFLLRSIADQDNIRAYYLLIVILIYLISFEIFKVYKPIWRYAGLREISYLTFACMTASVISIFAFVLIEKNIVYMFFSIFITFVSSIIIVFSRIIYKSLLKYRLNNTEDTRDKIVIVGAGSACAMLLKNLGEVELRRYNIVAIFDDNPDKHGKEINGVKVLGNCGLIPTYCNEHQIDNIVIAINVISQEDLNNILDICMMTHCVVRIMPTMSDIINDYPLTSWNKISEVKIEDLLGRPSIELSTPLLRSSIENKVVMVTGGGGSIGSELCRQIALNNPKQLIILDYYENNAYEIQQELIRKHKEKLNFVVEICNVREMDKVDKIMQIYKPNLVYHAAAHKHVPLMEHNPEEAVKNNVFGTYNVATCASKYGVEKFTLISSDKAVNPTNVMGATKRICEMIIQSLNNTSSTKFVAVRFGNVLGSNGSVVPLFKKQIAEGGPVTVTHPDMVRYFMTIKEAVSLVLTASASDNNGAVYVLDMGSPIRIYDFAIKMIRLSGFTPHKDIKVVFTGLRPGEKLFEELLVTEGKEKTAYNKIFVESLATVQLATIEKALTEFRTILSQDAFDYESVKSIIKELVPTYVPPKVIGIESLPTLSQK